MYKLIGVGGSIRGKMFEIHDGETIVGRGEGSNIKLNYDGISKKHFKITNLNGSLILEDLGSSNGTFINEKMVKNQYLKPGDLVSVPGAIFQVIRRRGQEQKEELVEDNVQRGSDYYSGNSVSFEESVKKDSKSVLLKFLHNHIMKIIYEMNGKYQWKSIVTILIAMLTLSNIFFTIGPVLEDAHLMLISELKQRAKQYVDEVERTNAVMLSRLQIDNINDLSLRQAESDIQSYLIFDSNGRVIRPVDKLNTHINDSFAVALMEWSKLSEDNTKNMFIKQIGEGAIGVGKAIRVMNMETQRENVVGYVAIKFMPVTLTTIAMSNRLAYVKALIISGAFAFIFFLLIYHVTVRPLQEITWQVQQANLGRSFENKSNYLMQELKNLRKYLEQTFLRLKETTESNNNAWDKEDEQPHHERAYQIMGITQCATMVLDSQKNILYLNPKGEDLLGIRESMTQGSSLLEVLRDQGVAAQILHLCEESANNNGQSKSGDYDIKGEKSHFSAVSLIGKDREAKAFIITFKTINET